MAGSIVIAHICWDNSMIAVLLAMPSGCFTIGGLNMVGAKEGSGSCSCFKWLMYFEIASLSCWPSASSLVSVVDRDSEETIVLKDNNEVVGLDGQSQGVPDFLNGKASKGMLCYI